MGLGRPIAGAGPSTMIRQLAQRVRLSLNRFAHEQDGNIIIISALMIPILLAAFGLSFEGAHWYQSQRAMQNAADSAAIAASMNGGTGYAAEARAVTAQYGFTDGVSSVAVTASNSATC